MWTEYPPPKTGFPELVCVEHYDNIRLKLSEKMKNPWFKEFYLNLPVWWKNICN
jgi:hypothetical protein